MMAGGKPVLADSGTRTLLSCNLLFSPCYLHLQGHPRLLYATLFSGVFRIVPVHKSQRSLEGRSMKKIKYLTKNSLILVFSRVHALSVGRSVGRSHFTFFMILFL